jgi:hypothetical protein
MPKVLGLLWLTLVLRLFGPLAAAEVLSGRDLLESANVVWTTPSEDSSGSMPLGNGDLGLNLWVEPTGDLVFYLSKSDAWDAHVRLLKLGRVRIRLLPEGLPPGTPFQQTLRPGEGTIEIRRGVGTSTATLRVWVDANHPVVRVEVDAQQPVALEAQLETWRNQAGPLVGKQLDAARGLLGAPYPLVVPADTVVDVPNRVVWYHRNVTSGWPITMKVQGLEAITRPSDDPLRFRTFGGAMTGEGLVKAGPKTLRSRQPARPRPVSIVALTKQPATEAQWLAELDSTIARVEAIPLGQARAAHRAWWKAFWDRSWIDVAGAGTGPEMSTNDLPLRIGANSEGGSRFVGRISRPMVFNRALSPNEVAALAGGQDEGLLRDPALVACWNFDNLNDGVFASAVPGGLPAKAVGQVEVADGPHGKAIHLNGKGWVEAADHPKLDLTAACTLAAWVAREKASSADGRILDKSRVGTNNGYLLDTFPGNSLRMITEPCTLTHKANLAPGRWTHVAGVFDSAGELCLYLDGKRVASQRIGASLDTVNQGYALQRFITACAGRGAMPIKFNGSLFTVDAEGSDGDYRRWGGCYWWQNTRFAYWPMLAAGDFDLMQPLFRMYLDALPLAKGITQTYYHHDGAFFAETIYFWGTPCNDDFGWKRDGHPQSLMLNPYIRRNWVGGLELSMMMLDYYDFTGDRQFARDRLVPLADAVATFYAKHYPREPDGTLRIEPAQALETWWTAVNPMPEVAGLHAVLPRLVALPDEVASADQRARWNELRAKLPPVPLRQEAGKAILAPAKEFSHRGNIENPELYAIFPFRLYGVGKKDLDLARTSFAARHVKGSVGWQQDPVQAALLGLGPEAAKFVVHRFATKHAQSRFPAFWGPNFDWVPDQDHGGNGMLGLQAMILQYDGEKILLLPAWPKEWDVSFRLHAPRQTVVEGVLRKGRWERLKVTPESRAKDVVDCAAATPPT